MDKPTDSEWDHAQFADRGEENDKIAGLLGQVGSPDRF